MGHLSRAKINRRPFQDATGPLGLWCPALLDHTTAKSPESGVSCRHVARYCTITYRNDAVMHAVRKVCQQTGASLQLLHHCMRPFACNGTPVCLQALRAAGVTVSLGWVRAQCLATCWHARLVKQEDGP